MDKGPSILLSLTPSKVRGSGSLLPSLQIPNVWLSKGKRDELGALGLRLRF